MCMKLQDKMFVAVISFLVFYYCAWQGARVVHNIEEHKMKNIHTHTHGYRRIQRSTGIALLRPYSRRERSKHLVFVWYSDDGPSNGCFASRSCIQSLSSMMMPSLPSALELHLQRCSSTYMPASRRCTKVMKTSHRGVGRRDSKKALRKRAVAVPALA